MSTWIQNKRKSSGISQSEVAKSLGISRPTYIKIEQGKAKASEEQNSLLACILNVSKNTFEKGVGFKKISNEIKLKEIPKENLEKFKQVLLYIISKVGGRPNIGQTALYKLLYFIDFDFYEKYEKQIMGAVYIKNHFGPTPAAFPKILSDMEKVGDITPVVNQLFKYQQKKYLPLRKPNLSLLSAEEKDHIDWVLSRLSDKNAKEMEEYSHRDVPWISAKDQSVIDYETVFYRTPDFSVRSYD